MGIDETREYSIFIGGYRGITEIGLLLQYATLMGRIQPRIINYFNISVLRKYSSLRPDIIVRNTTGIVSNGKDS
jgi:hypothetical protein